MESTVNWVDSKINSSVFILCNNFNCCHVKSLQKMRIKQAVRASAVIHPSQSALRYRLTCPNYFHKVVKYIILLIKDCFSVSVN